MIDKLYVELSKLPINEDVNKTIFLLATNYNLVIHNWELIKKLEKKRLYIIIKSAAIFVNNVVNCSDKEFYELWGKNKEARLIRELCKKYPLSTSNTYKAHLRIQSKLNEISKFS